MLTIENQNSGVVVSRIEALIGNILDQLSNSQELSIDFISRRTVSRRREGHVQQLRFPGPSLNEAKRFARVLLILQLSHHALVCGIVLTKRHIFYQHQELFVSQNVVDELVDDIASTLRVNRDDLNIVAAAKGILLGPALMRLQDGTAINTANVVEGTSVPLARSLSSIDIQKARWILIVEKEAVFRSLASAKFTKTSLAGPGILFTAKGYPDLTSRLFLNFVQRQHPLLPMFVLTDYDPDGINIFACYAHGSKSFEHESKAGNLHVTWLGIKSRQFLELNEFSLDQTIGEAGLSNTACSSQSSVNSRRSGTSLCSTQSRDAVLSLSQRDRKTALSVLRKFSDRPPDDLEAFEVRRELQVMLMLGVKAEIQLLDDGGDLFSWLESTIHQSLYEVPVI